MYTYNGMLNRLPLKIVKRPSALCNAKCISENNNLRDPSKQIRVLLKYKELLLPKYLNRCFNDTLAILQPKFNRFEPTPSAPMSQSRRSSQSTDISCKSSSPGPGCSKHRYVNELVKRSIC